MINEMKDTVGDGSISPAKPDGPMRQRLPEWLKVRLPASKEYGALKQLIRRQHLNTVCEGARCPNIGECWGAGTATFMILGDVCTRACKFCAVKSGRPPACDLDEPRRVAEAIGQLRLQYAVITSVDRDDLADGGAAIFSETVRLTRESCPGIRIEVLIPDFQGDRRALRSVVEAGPDVLAHNLETVPRLYRNVRSGSKYPRSLEVLRSAKSFGMEICTKSSLMLGLGETEEEVVQVMKDLRAAQADILTLGQYLQPSKENLPVARFYAPSEFASLRDLALTLGFSYVQSGPLVRSSYRAEMCYDKRRATRQELR
jgi:lipoic acid synthetase